MSSASGISEYVQSNGQTLNAGNYNEMDALTLASLSYIEFEKVYPDYQDRSVSVSQFAKDALASNISLSKTQRQMLDALAESDRYSECYIHNMEAENTSSQWAAMTVDINDGSNTSIIAARGTDGTTLGWNEDFQLAYDDDGTEAQKLMAEYLQNSDAGNIFLTGHSKGGNNVVSAYVMADSTVRDRVVHIDNFDGPGVNDEFREQFREGYAELEGKLDNYYPQDSVIGLLLNDNPGEEHFVYCEQSEEYKSMWILAEHDPYAWHVNEDKTALQSTDQSRLSDALNRILDNTLDQLTQEERRQVVNALITMQVPALIGEEGTLYSVFDEPLKWMNIAFGERNTVATTIINIAYKITTGFMLYNSLTEEQKALLKKTLGTLIVQAVEICVMPTVNEMLDWLAEKYRFVAGVVRDIQAELEDLADLILNFAETIHEEVGTWCNQVLEFLFGSKTHYGQGAGGPATFEVDVQALVALAEELQMQQHALQACSREVRQISQSLLWQISVCAGWQVGRLAGNVEEEARACGRMVNALQKSGQQYMVVETHIAAAAGL